MGASETAAALVLVTGPNGFLGSHIATALAQAGAKVRAVVRRAGTALHVKGVEKHVGAFEDPKFAAGVYSRSAGDQYIDKCPPLIGDGDADYAVTNHDTETVLAEIERIAGVLVRPSEIFGPEETPSSTRYARPSCGRKSPAAR